MLTVRAGVVYEARIDFRDVVGTGLGSGPRRWSILRYLATGAATLFEEMTRLDREQDDEQLAVMQLHPAGRGREAGTPG